MDAHLVEATSKAFLTEIRIRARKIDVIVVYKVDRLTRSLADFAKLVELFDAQGVSFVSVTQQFNTTTSMGRLTLNVLLSFAQFEREVTSERIRDKIAASKRKGLWVGGPLPLGYEMKDGNIAVVEDEAERVRRIYRRSAITAILVRGRAWPHNGTQGYVWVAGSHLFGWYEVGPASGQAVCRGANKRTAGKGRWHPQGRPDARGWYQRCPKGRFSGYAALSSLSSPRATILSALSCNGPLQRILERDELATARQRDRIVKPSFLSAISSHPQILRMPRQPTAVKKSAANNEPINFQAVCRSAYAVSRLAPNGQVQFEADRFVCSAVRHRRDHHRR
jgi:hypothetical protein